MSVCTYTRLVVVVALLNFTCAHSTCVQEKLLERDAVPAPQEVLHAQLQQMNCDDGLDVLQQQTRQKRQAREQKAAKMLAKGTMSAASHGNNASLAHYNVFGFNYSDPEDKAKAAEEAVARRAQATWSQTKASRAKATMQTKASRAKATMQTKASRGAKATMQTKASRGAEATMQTKASRAKATMQTKASQGSRERRSLRRRSKRRTRRHLIILLA